MSEETPKLHGWITPEYAEQMVDDLLKYLKKYGKEKASIYDLALRGISERCQLLSNAQDVLD